MTSDAQYIYDTQADIESHTDALEQYFSQPCQKCGADYDGALEHTINDIEGSHTYTP